MRGIVRRIAAAAAFVLGAGLATPCLADMTAAELMKNRSSQVATLYLVGVSNGIEWANAFQAGQNRPLLYCPPQEIKIQPDQYFRFIEEYLKIFPEDARQPVGAVLMGALIRGFPCK